jgi:hypothetical protein
MILGLSGYAQSGKDTAAGFLIERGWKRLAFADALRDSVYHLNPFVPMPLPDAPDHWARVRDIVDWKGWDVAKVEYPEIRRLLQRMGTEVGRDLYGENFWVDRVLAQIRGGQNYVITDVRFPNEVEAVHSVGGLVYRIYREGVGAVNSHVSDSGIDDLEIDGILLNDGDLADLEQRVLMAVGL